MRKLTNSKRFAELLMQDNTNNEDRERKALFFIIANNEELYNNRDLLYDFDNHLANEEDLKNIELSSSAMALIRLAYNLYNHYVDDATDVLSIMRTLDAYNYMIAIESINIRFNKN